MIAASLVVSFIASVVYTLYLGYEVGASQFAGPAFMAGARGNWDGLATTMASPLAMTASEYLFMALGAAIGGILVFAGPAIWVWRAYTNLVRLEHVGRYDGCHLAGRHVLDRCVTEQAAGEGFTLQVETCLADELREL